MSTMFRNVPEKYGVMITVKYGIGAALSDYGDIDLEHSWSYSDLGQPTGVTHPNMLLI